MRKDIVFIDIDTQHDFMDKDGALAVAGAASIRGNLKRLTHTALRLGIPTIASEDAHDPDDPEFKQFPPHCIKGSQGAVRIDETSLPEPMRVDAGGDLPGLVREVLASGQVVLEKRTLDVFSNPAMSRLLAALPGARAVVYGVATEYCIKAAVEGLLERGRAVSVVRDAVKGVSQEQHNRTLDGLGRAGARLVTTDEVIEGLEA